MALVLGCIADDFTGATDLANTLVGRGMRTVQAIGVPAATFEAGDAEAVVVALKSRTAPVREAVAESLDALAWLRAQGARQYFFKYCSTFDSTDQGNIGPVADALLEALGEGFTIACPAFPANARTVYQGHLFIGDQLLSESGMKDHPLTPMRDANLPRVLGRQTPGRVGLVDMQVVGRGAAAIAAALASMPARGFRYAVVDAITEADLHAIGEAASALTLVTGGSGVALGLPANFRRSQVIGEAAAPSLPSARGRRAVLAGSCSIATRAQVAAVGDRWPTLVLDPMALAGGEDPAPAIGEWADPELPLLVTSSATPEGVARIHAALGRAAASALVEREFGRIARRLVDLGVRELIVAGGETAGAVVEALGIRGLRIGPEIDPGVPWCETVDTPRLALALKSGNFGAEDFFPRAFSMLQ